LASASEALDGTYRASRRNHRIKVKKPTWQAMKAAVRCRRQAGLQLPSPAAAISTSRSLVIPASIRTFNKFV